MAETAPQGVSVHLLDPEGGRALQTWTFERQELISIGRGDEESIALADPYVSRHHAEVVFRNESWRLISKGRNGVVVDGKAITDCPLKSGMVFRLGVAGPMLRFENAAARPEMATLSFDAESMIVMEVDRQRVQDDTRAVMETDFFQELQRKARELRQQHATP